MLKISTLILALVALLAHTTLAQTPACLLAAVNEQSDPSNVSGMCTGSNATAVTSYLCKNCAGNTKAALSSFSSACSDAGVTIASDGACSSKGGSSSGTQTSSQTSSQTTQNGGSSSTTTAAGGAATTATTTTDADANDAATASASQSADGAEGTNAADGISAGKGGMAAALLLGALAAW